MVSTGEIVARRFGRREGPRGSIRRHRWLRRRPSGRTLGRALIIEGRPNACEAVGPSRGFWYMLNRPAWTPGVI